MSEETLYPHEVLIKWLNNNVLKIAATLFFVLCGLYCLVGVIKTQPSTFLVGIISYLFGWVAYEYDIKCRGLK
jgi:nicotinamide riboside transporter PnuC